MIVEEYNRWNGAVTHVGRRMECGQAALQRFGVIPHRELQADVCDVAAAGGFSSNRHRDAAANKPNRKPERMSRLLW